MKKVIFILYAFSFLTYSCNNEIDALKKEINELQSVIALQNAFAAKKTIVSVTSANIDKTDCWQITFADNTMLPLPKDIVESVTLNEITEVYTIILKNEQQYVFYTKEMVFPTGLAVLTNEVKFLKNTEVAIEFRVNPSNAIFNYDVNSGDCQIAFDMTNKVTIRSYVTDPEQCRLTRIEQVKDTNGNVREGQYIAYVVDNGGYNAYVYNLALVMSTKDQDGNAIQLSSSAITLERKKDTHLPVVIIHTENKTEIMDKENWINATMIIDGVGLFPDYEGTTGIRGRGNSTWAYPKKPFALKLDTKSEILGMPSHKRWVLLANYIDRTLIRNHIAFEISKRTGLEWTVRGEFVEVVLNDVHLGNYYLCEQIKPDNNRVDITEMKANDLDEESITGGYLLEFDSNYDEVNKFRSKIFDYPVMFKEPDEEVLQPAQLEYMQNYINTFEELLTAPDFATTREYVSLIADTTFIDWWFVMELTCNDEAIHPRSSYFYKDRMDVLKAGPIWDSDWKTFAEQKVMGFYAKESLYYSQLFKDPEFVRKVKERWATFKPAFEEITELILTVGLSLDISAELNDAMWSLQNVNNNNEDNLYSFNSAIHRMSGIYANRLKWLDGQIRLMR